MRLRISLLIILFVILFPMTLLDRFSADIARIFNAIFAPEWTHLVAHTLLFAALSALVILLFRMPCTVRAILMMIGIMLGVGIFQEVIQALSGGEGGLSGALFDLGVDLVGGGLGALAAWGFCPPGLKKR